MGVSGRLLIVGMDMVGSAVRSAGWTARFETVTASRKSPGAAQHLDIGDPDDVKSFFRRNAPFDAVINCAAEANVDACEKDPQAARRVNALGVRWLAEGCLKTGTALVHISTDYVFDGLAARPYTEDDATGPCSAYGISKLEGEHYALTVPRVSAVIRSTWIFGGTRMDFVNGMIERIRKGEKPAVVDDQTASPAYAGDLGDALGRVVERFALPARASGKRSNRVFHISNQGQATRHAMAVRIARTLGAGADLPRASAADIPGWIAVRPRYTVLATGRADRELGVRPGPWEEALDAHVRRSGGTR
jgi:dTDP-4-dehydrorhamnose reductase